MEIDDCINTVLQCLSQMKVNDLIMVNLDEMLRDAIIPRKNINEELTFVFLGSLDESFDKVQINVIRVDLLTQ